jgi:hypothetical protein
MTEPNKERQQFRASLRSALKAYLAGDGSLWGRMASSHAEAKAEDKTFLDLVERAKAQGITPEQIEDFIDSLPPTKLIE